MSAQAHRPSSQAWATRAACRSHPEPDLWHPPPRPPQRKGFELAAWQRRVDEPLRVCGRCPIADQCLAYALAHGMSGIWGGRYISERAAMTREAS